MEELLRPAPPRVENTVEEDDQQGDEQMRPTTVTDNPESSEVPSIEHNPESSKHPSTTTAATILPSEIKAVVCISTCSLLPYTNKLQTSENNTMIRKNASAYIDSYRSSNSSTHNAPTFKFSTLDIRRLLHTLSQWQQESTGRAVLLSGPMQEQVDSAEVYAYPCSSSSDSSSTTTNNNNNASSSKDISSADLWDSERSKLQQVLLGGLTLSNKASLAYYAHLSYIHSYNQNNEILKKECTVLDSQVLYKSYYNILTKCQNCCFWDVCFQPQQPPIQCSTSSTGVIAAPNAKFLTDCVSNISRGSVVVELGPVIGGVTSTSGNVLLQVRFIRSLFLIIIYLLYLSKC